MKTHPVCPICKSLQQIQIAQFYSQIIAPAPTMQQAGINAILSYVLHLDCVHTDTKMCRKCKHIYLSPTFDDGEIDRLYSPECLAETKRQYRITERITQKSWAEHHGVKPSHQRKLLLVSQAYRSRRLLELISDATGRRGDDFISICDFGANTGALTSEFTASRRYVFDKDLSQVTDSELIRLYSFEDLHANGPFDLLILSHVLEHVPFPVELVKTLRHVLKPNGCIYVEAPLQYCGSVIKRRGIPIGVHVNYFTRLSLLKCLYKAGFPSILTIRREIAPYGECQEPVLKAIAAKSKSALASSPMSFRPWIFDLLIDCLLMLKARQWPNQFK